MTTPGLTIHSTSTTKIKGGFSKLLQIWEDLRDRNTNGYKAKVGGMVANVKGKDHYDTSTTCSPFTGACIGAALDPTYPHADNAKNPYVPMWNGGAEEMKFYPFYEQHNDKNRPIESLVEWGIGEEIEDFRMMRRGDVLGIDWSGGDGHAVFCWDVHFDDQGLVDCFQILGCNVPDGVTIDGCGVASGFLTGAASDTGPGTLAKATKFNGKIFVDSPDVMKHGNWYAVPNVDYMKIKAGPLFTPTQIRASGTKNGGKYNVNKLKVGRLFFDGDQPPGSYVSGGGYAGGQSAPAPSAAAASPAAPAATPPPPAAAPTPPASAPVVHATVSSTPVSAADVKASPGIKNRLPAKPVTQDPSAPLMSRAQIQSAMEIFFNTKWITVDPATDYKNAVIAFQTLFGLSPDGDPGPITKKKIEEELPACILQRAVQVIYSALFGGKQLDTDPGVADGTNHDQAAAATKSFQTAHNLTQTGVPDAATQAAATKVYASLAPTSTQQGLNPAVVGLYWVGNGVAPGGSATLRLVSNDLKVGQTFKIFLKDLKGGSEVDAKTTLTVAGTTSEVSVAMPADFALGVWVSARATGTLGGGKGDAEISTPAPLEVRNPPPVGAATDGLEVFFRYKGWIGETASMPSNPTAEQKHATWAKNKAFTYVGYRVPGKTSWFVRGRGMVDIDGAPNCYHPTNKNVVRPGELMTYDVMSLARPLDSLADGPSGLQSKPGDPDGWGPNKLYIQKAGELAPGYLVMATPLKRAEYDHWDPRKYADARVTPFLAIPLQIVAQKNTPSTVDNFGGYEPVGTGHTGNYGDIVTVINLNPVPYFKGETMPDYVEMIEIDGKKYPIAHGIVGDAGNQPHIGECSYALAKAAHTLHGPAFADVLWMYHPGSGQGQNVIPEVADIKAKGQQLFNAWGGQAQLQKIMALPQMKVSGRE